MNKSKILIAFLTITIGVLLCIYTLNHLNINKVPNDQNRTDPHPGKIEQTDYVIVKSAFMNQTNILKPNAALLITEKQEINNFQELFLAKRSITHLCGYDYSIQFWNSTDSLSHEVSLNEKCDVFDYKPQETHKKIEELIRKLETSPTHFIYNLEIPVFSAPESVKAEFINSDMKLCFIEKPSNRFPSIVFSYRSNSFVGKNSIEKKWKEAEKENKKLSEIKIKSIIDIIAESSTIIEKSDIFYNSFGRSGDSITHNGNVELKFKLGTDLTQIINLLKKQGAIVLTSNNPKYYSIQLIDAQSNIDSVKLKVEKYKIIHNVTEYSE